MVRSPFRTKAEAPRQPAAALGVEAVIELFEGCNYEDALQDLEGWERLWVVFWFHLVEGWRPKVLPPRSEGKRRGVFSTRSPHRPNPLGLSVVRLERVQGLRVHVRDVDLVDGTPVLDLKPYVAYADAHPGARMGWLEEGARPLDGEPTSEAGERAFGRAPADPRPDWQVTWSPLASEQLAFLAERGLGQLGASLEKALALGPQPHAYRRIRAEPGGTSLLALKDWRARFRVDGPRLEVLTLLSGYRPVDLAKGESRAELQPHLAFVARWGWSPSC